MPHSTVIIDHPEPGTNRRSGACSESRRVTFDSRGARGQNLGMAGRQATVYHAVCAEISAERLETLRVLRERTASTCRVRVVHVGGGKAADGLPLHARVQMPLQYGWLATPTLSSLAATDDPYIVHVWSSRALAWAASHTGAGYAPGGVPRALLVQADSYVDLPRLARWWRSLKDRTNTHFVCPTAISRRRLVEVGVAANDAVLIRDSLDFGALNLADPAGLRKRLGLTPSDTVVLVLPPVTRAAGSINATWAALVLQKVLPGVRVLVPGDGRETRRINRLVRSTVEDGVTRFDRGRLTFAELMAASDLAVFVPAGDAPVGGLVWAMGAGVPIVGSAVPAVTELLAHGHNAWLCRPNDPKDATRRMLQALERKEEARRLAETARAQAFKAFGRQRMVEQYEAVYANLLAGRRVGEGIGDSTLV